jgi:hypothetical protein
MTIGKYALTISVGNNTSATSWAVSSKEVNELGGKPGITVNSEEKTIKIDSLKGAAALVAVLFGGNGQGPTDLQGALSRMGMQNVDMNALTESSFEQLCDWTRTKSDNFAHLISELGLILIETQKDSFVTNSNIQRTEMQNALDQAKNKFDFDINAADAKYDADIFAAAGTIASGLATAFTAIISCMATTSKAKDSRKAHGKLEKAQIQEKFGKSNVESPETRAEMIKDRESIISKNSDEAIKTQEAWVKTLENKVKNSVDGQENKTDKMAVASTTIDGSDPKVLLEGAKKELAGMKEQRDTAEAQKTQLVRYGALSEKLFNFEKDDTMAKMEAHVKDVDAGLGSRWARTAEMASQLIRAHGQIIEGSTSIIAAASNRISALYNAVSAYTQESANFLRSRSESAGTLASNAKENWQKTIQMVQSAITTQAETKQSITRNI